MGKLQALTHLQFRTESIIENLDVVADCSKLIKLEVFLKEQQGLFDRIDQLKELQYLRISIRDEENYPLEKFPDKIAALPKLKEVAIYQNSFDAAERKRVRALLPNCTVYV